MSQADTHSSTTRPMPGSIIGWRKNGKPIRLFAGGAPDPDPDPAGGQDPPPDPKAGGGGDPKPPWGDDPDLYDPAKAWAKMQALQGDRDRARTERDTYKGKVDEVERGKLTAQQQAEADRDQFKTRAEAAESQLTRFEVMAEKGLTAAQAKRLVGASKDELLADADQLLADIGRPAAGGGSPVDQRPRPNLRGGGAPDDPPDETDPAKLAARIPRN